MRDEMMPGAEMDKQAALLRCPDKGPVDGPALFFRGILAQGTGRGQENRGNRFQYVTIPTMKTPQNPHQKDDKTHNGNVTKPTMACMPAALFLKKRVQNHTSFVSILICRVDSTDAAGKAQKSVKARMEELDEENQISRAPALDADPCPDADRRGCR
ncbi:MAG: hypothetical protein GX611_06680 [Clostridiales bacterium]|nr:hypothetical protein [Clostridiales bacterium]